MIEFAHLTRDVYNQRAKETAYETEKREFYLAHVNVSTCKYRFFYLYIYLKVLLEKYGVFIAALSSLQRREGENGISYVLRISGSSPIWFRRDEDICNQRAKETSYSCFEGTVYLGFLYSIVC